MEKSKERLEEAAMCLSVMEIGVPYKAEAIRKLVVDRYGVNLYYSHHIGNLLKPYVEKGFVKRRIGQDYSRKWELLQEVEITIGGADPIKFLQKGAGSSGGWVRIVEYMIKNSEKIKDDDRLVRDEDLRKVVKIDGYEEALEDLISDGILKRVTVMVKNPYVAYEVLASDERLENMLPKGGKAFKS
jgi:hypothetical protein